jgi:hypothetical protein
MNVSHPEPTGSEEPKADPVPQPSRDGSMRDAILLALVGIVAAVISTVVIGLVGSVFELPEELLVLTRGTIPGPDEQKLIGAGLVILNYKHLALWIGLCGAITGALFSLVLGYLRGSRDSMAPGVLKGLIVGGLVAAVAGLASNFIAENVIAGVRQAKIQVPEQYSMLMHAITWAIFGLGIGFGAGLGSSQDRVKSAISSMLICAVAGAAGGAFYPFFTSAVMPLVDPAFAIPKGELNRIVWMSIPCALIGLVLGRKSATA